MIEERKTLHEWFMNPPISKERREIRIEDIKKMTEMLGDGIGRDKDVEKESPGRKRQEVEDEEQRDGRRAENKSFTNVRIPPTIQDIEVVRHRQDKGVENIIGVRGREEEEAFTSPGYFSNKYNNDNPGLAALKTITRPYTKGSRTFSISTGNERGIGNLVSKNLPSQIGNFVLDALLAVISIEAAFYVGIRQSIIEGYSLLTGRNQ